MQKRWNQVLLQLTKIRDLKGNGCIGKKQILFEKLIEDTKGQVLKLFDKKAAKELNLNTSKVNSAEKHLSEEPVDMSVTLSYIISLNQMISNTEGLNSVNKKILILAKVLDNTASQYRELVKPFYEKKVFNINFEQKNIVRLFNRLYPEKSKQIRAQYGKFEKYNLYKIYKSLIGCNTGDFDSSVNMEYHKPMLSCAVKIDSKIDLNRYYAELKYDGIRCMIRKEGQKLIFWSRSGLIFIAQNMKKILDGEFISFLEGIEGDFVIDGQVWSPHLSAGEGFRMILPLVKTKTLTKEFKTDRKFVFTVFDIVQYKRESLQSRTYISRRAKLHQLKFTKYMSEIVPLKTIDDLELYLQGLKNTYFEGLILKKKDSIYQPGKRSRDWLKVKSSFENLDVKVISYAKGTGKYKQIYSTFEVAVLDNKELKSIGHVGSGFKQIDYEELQKLISENKQIVIEVECEAITKSEKYSSGFGLRFPRFKRLRLQKTYPDSLETVKKIFSIK